MARGPGLNILVVLAAVHGFLGLPGWSAQSSLFTLSVATDSLPYKMKKSVATYTLQNEKISGDLYVAERKN